MVGWAAVPLVAMAAMGGLPAPAPTRARALEGTRVRRLSATNALVMCLFLESYSEGRRVKVLPITTLSYLLSCGRACAVRPMLLRYHVVPIVQGVVTARIARYIARILYAKYFQELFTPKQPERERDSLYASPAVEAGRVRGGGRSVTRLARRIGAVPRRALIAPIKHQWRWAVGTGAKIAGVGRRGGAPAVASAAADAAPAPAPPAPAPAPPPAAAAASATPTASATATEPATTDATAFMSLPLRSAPPPTAGEEASLAVRAKKRVLILISDTGGGHRASAQALAESLRRRHGDAIETSIVDVWTSYGPGPFGKQMVPYYRGLAKRPRLWYAHFKATKFTPACYLMSRVMSTFAYKGFETCIQECATPHATPPAPDFCPTDLHLGSHALTDCVAVSCAVCAQSLAGRGGLDAPALPGGADQGAQGDAAA